MASIGGSASPAMALFSRACTVPGLAREVGAQPRVVLQRGFDEEERGRDFQRLRFGRRDVLRAKVRRHFRERIEHRVDVAVGQPARALGKHDGLLAERIERGAVARGVLEPGVLLLRGDLAHLADHRGEVLVVRVGRVQAAIGQRHQHLEAEGVLQHHDALGDRLGARHGEEQVAEQALGDLLRPVDGLLDLLVELGEERLGRAVVLDAGEHERVEESRGRGPERPVRRRRLQRFDGEDGAVHGSQRLGRVGPFQHAQQALLVERALVRERLGEHRVVELLLRGQRGKLRGQVREEEIAFVGVGSAAAAVQLDERRQQAQRLVRLPGDQRIEVRRKRGDALLGDGDRGRQLRRVILLQERDQLLQLLVEARGGPQAHHRERSGGLVQVREDVLDRGAVGRIRDQLVEVLARLVERMVDLGLDPREGSKVEIGDCRVCRHLAFLLLSLHILGAAFPAPTA
jgi:hypothetical protein